MPAATYVLMGIFIIFFLSLKCGTDTEVKYEKILIALGVAVRIEGKINPRRSNRQQILQAEPDPGTKVVEKIVEGVGDDIGSAVKCLLTLFLPGAIGRDIAVVKENRTDEISDQALAQFDIEHIASIAADGSPDGSCGPRSDSLKLRTVFSPPLKNLSDSGRADIIPARQEQAGRITNPQDGIGARRKKMRTPPVRRVRLMSLPRNSSACSAAAKIRWPVVGKKISLRVS